MRKLAFLLIYSILAFSIPDAAATNTESVAEVSTTARNDLSDELSDERFKAYEDSLLKTLYPKVWECHSDQQKLLDWHFS